MLGGGLERPLEIVEHRQELLDQPLVGARDQALLVARHPLAVVVELGREPLQVVEMRVALPLDLDEPLSQFLQGHKRSPADEVVLSGSEKQARLGRRERS